MVAGPEQARKLKEFEASFSEGSEMPYNQEEAVPTQQSFKEFIQWKSLERASMVNATIHLW